jgi:hypothetical protein
MERTGTGHKQVDTRKNHELFFYWHPQMIVQGYNATVQGGLFSKGSGAVLKDIEPWMFQQNWGICYAEGRWTTQLALVPDKGSHYTKRSAYGMDLCR